MHAGPPVTHAGLKPRKMACVAVLGGGLMGSGIATALVQAGYEVLLKEVNQQFLEVCACAQVWEERSIPAGCPKKLGR